MSVKYVARKCNQCAGKLEYVKETKLWKCLYCGSEIERDEQYDGLYTIKNVVRQVILDVAYRRLDTAEKNLVECEKIDSRYIGTIIARIAFQMITAVTPGAYPQAELRNLFSQLKRNYASLCEISKDVTGDEEALYEFFDNGDVYATLLLVYDSLNDTIRRDYISDWLNAKEVYAKEPNKNLLSFALKNARYELVDEIMEVPDNVESGFALDEILQKYPDNENKINNIERLLQSQTFKSEDKRIIERYLSTSCDSAHTKGKVVVSAFSADIRASLEEIITRLLSNADCETVETVLQQICNVRLSDEDVYKIIEFSVSASEADTSVAVLSVLKDTNQYVMMTSKYIIALLSRTDLAANDKTSVLKKMLEFKVDAKTMNSAITNYLCYNKEPSDVRLAVLDTLFSMVSVIQTATVEDYILNNNTDGELKPDIVEKIFSLELNKSFFNDLLTKYMNSTTDVIEVKNKIVAILSAKGIKIESNALISYICFGNDSVSDKVTFVKRMLLNGTNLRGDTVNSYLENVKPEQFSSELFGLILKSASNVSEQALANYLLNYKDRDSLKVESFTFLIKQCHKNIANIQGEAVCLGQKISGNILPLYVLATPDSIDVTKEIVDFLIGHKVKLNTDISASGMGKVKFKKFISVYRCELTAVASEICAAYGI